MRLSSGEKARQTVKIHIRFFLPAQPGSSPKGAYVTLSPLTGNAGFFCRHQRAQKRLALAAGKGYHNGGLQKSLSSISMPGGFTMNPPAFSFVCPPARIPPGKGTHQRETPPQRCTLYRLLLRIMCIMRKSGICFSLCKALISRGLQRCFQKVGCIIITQPVL